MKTAVPTNAGKPPKTIEDSDMNLFRSLDRDADGVITRDEILQPFVRAGLTLSDRRFSDSLERLNQFAPTGASKIDAAAFQQIARPNIHLIRRVLKGQLIIPDFADFCGDIAATFDEAKKNDGGDVADYIPQLARVDGSRFGIGVCTVDGQRFFRGDYLERFTVQSTSKPITYCLALEELGLEKVHRHVGREPSGQGFNELTLNSRGLPHNPMINAGAIMCCALLGHEMAPADRFDYVVSKWSAMSGHSRVDFNNAVYLSERETAHRNRALSHYMMEKRAFPEWAGIDEVLEFYFQCCSIETNCDQMSLVAATLANGGTCPITCEKIFKTSTVQACLSLMSSCGMYDYSGEWAFSIGLPAKSGVSGAIMVVVPNVMGYCVWSPRLDAQGNSVRGVEFSQRLVEKFGFHSFDALDLQSEKKNPRISPIQRNSEEVTTLIEFASRGDLTAVEQYQIRGVDLDAGDYDGRTAMHLAAAEGHIGVVEFLIAHGADIDRRDRWGSTPLNDARRNGHAAVIELLKRHNARLGTDDGRQVETSIPGSVPPDVTAFIWAASVGNLDAMLPYVARGVSLDCADYDARTALHLAAAEGRFDVVKFLLDHGSSAESLDRWGRTPLDDAMRHDHRDIAALLRSASGQATEAPVPAKRSSRKNAAAAA